MTTVGTKIDSTLGTVGTLGTTGLQVAQDTNNKGFGPYPALGTISVVSSSASGINPVVLAGQAGILLVSGTTAALTVSLPTAASAIGGTYIFRSLDAQAHILSNSQETPGVVNIVSGVSAQKTKITLSGVVGSTAVLTCDGILWQHFTGFKNNPAT